MKFKFDPKLPKVSLNCEFLMQNLGKFTQFLKYLLGRLRVISKEASEFIFIAYCFCPPEDTTLRSFPSLWVCLKISKLVRKVTNPVEEENMGDPCLFFTTLFKS